MQTIVHFQKLCLHNQLTNFIKLVSDKSIEPELKKGKHKVDDNVTVDRKHSKNDIQGSEEEDKQLQSTAATNTVL